MRKILSLFCLSCLSFAGYSQTNITAVNINKINGERLVCLLENRPRMFFSSDSVIVAEAKTGLTFSYLKSEISNITFDNYTTTEISDVEFNIADVRLEYLDKNTIKIYGLDELSTVRIFDISGRIITTAIKSEYSGFAVINISELPTGIYIINVKGNSFKIKK